MVIVPGGVHHRHDAEAACQCDLRLDCRIVKAPRLLIVHDEVGTGRSEDLRQARLASSRIIGPNTGSSSLQSGAKRIAAHDRPPAKQ